MLPSDPEPRHFTGQFVQAQRDGDALFPSHRAVTLDLLLDGRLRCHRGSAYARRPSGSSVQNNTFLRPSLAPTPA